MKLDMHKLNANLKAGQFARCYLLYGEEQYLVRQYAKRICDAIVPENSQFNLSRFSGKDIDYREVIFLANTMPFFAEHRLIRLEKSGLFQSVNEEFLAYLPEAPDYTIFLFTEQTVDKRSKAYKWIVANGDQLEMESQRESVLKKWILQLARKEGLSMTESTAARLLGKTGCDMYTISNEMQKLSAYCSGEDSITDAAVDQICADVTPPQIFEMIRCISEKNSRQALRYYYELVQTKEQPMRILSLLLRQFRTMYQIRLLQNSHTGSYEIASRLGLSSYIADKYIRQAANFDEGELKQALYDCMETEYKIKSGLLTDRMGVELLIVTYADGQ